MLMGVSQPNAKTLKTQQTDKPRLAELAKPELNVFFCPLSFRGIGGGGARRREGEDEEGRCDRSRGMGRRRRRERQRGEEKDRRRIGEVRRRTVGFDSMFVLSQYSSSCSRFFPLCFFLVCFFTASLALRRFCLALRLSRCASGDALHHMRWAFCAGHFALRLLRTVSFAMCLVLRVLCCASCTAPFACLLYTSDAADE